MQRGFSILPYQHFSWGSTEPVEVEPLPEVIDNDGVYLVPVHTPGHSRDLTCYWEPGRGVLFSGDLYLADRIKFFRCDENIIDQIRSLRRVLDLDFDVLLCGHRPRSTGGRGRVAAKLQFLEDFFGRVEDSWRSGQSEHAIVRKLAPRGDRRISLVSFGNVGARHMVRSSLAAIRCGETAG